MRPRHLRENLSSSLWMATSDAFSSASTGYRRSAMADGCFPVPAINDARDIVAAMEAIMMRSMTAASLPRKPITDACARAT